MSPMMDSENNDVDYFIVIFFCRESCVMKSYADLCNEMSRVHMMLRSQTELVKKLSENPKQGECTQIYIFPLK